MEGHIVRADVPMRSWQLGGRSPAASAYVWSSSSLPRDTALTFAKEAEQLPQNNAGTRDYLGLFPENAELLKMLSSLY